MNKYLAGFAAGFLATLILALLMALKQHWGLMPGFDVIEDINEFFGSDYVVLGWVVHFILGTFIWGGVFAILLPVLLGPYWLKGLIYGILAWLLMMVGYMPMMEHGLFATELGLHVLIASLLLHLIYGLVLGLVYGWLPRKDKNRPLQQTV